MERNWFDTCAQRNTRRKINRLTPESRHKTTKGTFQIEKRKVAKIMAFLQCIIGTEGDIYNVNQFSIFFLACFSVPDQAPTILKTYLTSATSLRVSWTAVKEPIAGYQVAFRSISAGEWTSVYASAQTLSMHLENLKKGDVYRLRIAAFNAAGNGVPSDGTEIHLKEGGTCNVVNSRICNVSNTREITLFFLSQLKLLYLLRNDK